MKEIIIVVNKGICTIGTKKQSVVAFKLFKDGTKQKRIFTRREVELIYDRLGELLENK